MFSRRSKASEKMKKILCFLFALLLTLSLTSCNSLKNNNSSLQSCTANYNSSETEIIENENAESSDETNTVNTNSEQTNQVQGNKIENTQDKNSSTTSGTVELNEDDISPSSDSSSLT